MASIVCPKCGRESFNPNDVRERYCGACHRYHDQLVPTAFEAMVRDALRALEQADG